MFFKSRAYYISPANELDGIVVLAVKEVVPGGRREYCVEPLTPGNLFQVWKVIPMENGLYEITNVRTGNKISYEGEYLWRIEYVPKKGYSIQLKDGSLAFCYVGSFKKGDMGEWLTMKYKTPENSVWKIIEANIGRGRAW